MPSNKKPPEKAKETDKPAKELSFLETMNNSLEHISSRNIQLGLLVALGIAVVSVLVMNAFGGAEKVRDIVASAGAFAPLVFILLKASTYVIAPLSGTPLKLAAGALFGIWEGALYAIIGDVLGACLNFWIARLLRVTAVQKLAGKKALKQIDEVTQHVGGWRALLIARLFLSSLYDFISYAAGLSNLRFKHFFWVTLLAGIPSTLVSAWLGDSLVSNQPLFFGLIGLSVVSIVLVLVASKWLKQSGASK